MGKIIEYKITKFDGGIIPDGRTPSNDSCLLVKHFDIFTYPHRLVPFVSPESGDSAQTTHGIRQMLYYNSKVYGLGVTPNPPAIYERADFTGNTWTASTNGSPSSGAFNPNVFVAYQSRFYGWYSAANIWKFDPAGTAFTDSERAITGVGIQGLVHSKDDILYMPYNASGQGFIAKNNAGSWTSAALTLPKGLLISSICEYGNYLAIACEPQYGGKSVVFLWDRDSSVTTLSESIDFGEGNLKVIEEIEGYIIGISITDSAAAITPKITFRRYSGGGAVVFKEIRCSSAVGFNVVGKQKVNSKFYFMLGVTIDGSLLQGIWCIGRSTPSSDFSLSFSHDPVVSGGNAINSLTAFKMIGDYMFAVYSDATTDILTKTNDSPETAAGYNISSIYESLIFNSGDSSLTKDLQGITVTYDPLPTNGQVVLKYRIDAETSWTTIFTDTTDNAISHSAVGIESGDKITNFKEIQFRIESTGGAEITGFNFKTEQTGKREYE